MTAQKDIVPALAKLINYDTEVLQAINLPEHKLTLIYNRAHSGKKLIKWVAAPIFALAFMTYTAVSLKEDKSWRDIGIFATNVAAFCLAAGVGGARFKGAKRELDEARDAQLVTLAKIQSKNAISLQ